MSESKESELGRALNFLSNNWRHDPEMRLTFESIFKTLSNGTLEDQANAKVLKRYLSYPGSDSALSAAVSLNSALNAPAGRKKAGLKARGRGRNYRTQEVEFKDNVMQVLIRHELGLATDFDVVSAVIEYIGENAVDASRKAFIEELRPRAAVYADFYRRFHDALSKRTSI